MTKYIGKHARINFSQHPWSHEKLFRNIEAHPCLQTDTWHAEPDPLRRIHTCFVTTFTRAFPILISDVYQHDVSPAHVLRCSNSSRFHAPFRTVSVYHLNVRASFQHDGTPNGGAFTAPMHAYAIFAIRILWHIMHFLNLRHNAAVRCAKERERHEPNKYISLLQIWRENKRFHIWPAREKIFHLETKTFILFSVSACGAFNSFLFFVRLFVCSIRDRHLFYLKGSPFDFKTDSKYSI